MKQVTNFKLNISIVYMVILFIIGLFSLLADVLLNPGSIAFLIGGMVGTFISLYFAIIIPVRAMVELKQMRKK